MGIKSTDSTVMPTEVDLAWAAGILDGEGCICISVMKNSNYIPGRRQHQFSVTVANTDVRIPKKLHELFGGRINSSHGPRLRPQWNEAWRWAAYQRQAAAMLEAVMPYLVSKREQAEVALEFIGTMTPQGGSRYRRLDPEVLVQRDEMAKRLRLLKGRKEAV